tara:strand:+ start:266 stop:508 length:243 start_codon:yes stop_codon:yes gene_type:complete
MELESLKKLAVAVIKSDKNEDVEEYLNSNGGKFWSKIFIDSDENISSINHSSHLTSPFAQLNSHINQGLKQTSPKEELGF